MAPHEPFHAMAAEEQGSRDEAKLQRLPSKHVEQTLGLAAFDAAEGLSKQALKSLSLHRLLLTYKLYKESSWWESFDCGLANADGAMPLDKIDLDTTHETAASTWADFSGPAKPEDGPSAEQLDGVDCQHTVCGSGHGLCAKLPCLDSACKFSTHIHLLLKSGTSAASACSASLFSVLWLS